MGNQPSNQKPQQHYPIHYYPRVTDGPKSPRSPRRKGERSKMPLDIVQPEPTFGFLRPPGIPICREAVIHTTLPPYAYVVDSQKINIKIQTQRENVVSVFVIYGDPFLWKDNQWPTDTKMMQKKGTDDRYDYWTCQLEPKFRRCRYFFQLTGRDGETFNYGEAGWSGSKFASEQCFNFPYLHTSDLFSPPKWAATTIWYQIFPERFANGDASINPAKTLPWGETPTPSNFFGGDFRGIIDHMDYFVKLGITGVYFCPIFKAHSNHKYDTIDYMEIDPQFGDKATFKEMIQLFHKNGIKVILDAVFNHTGERFPYFQDLMLKGEKSQYVNWFHPWGFPVQNTPTPNYDTFGFYGAMPKLNTSNPETVKYLLDVVKYWMTEFQIDGWRLDVANEVDHTFWRKFRKVAKKINPEVFILGEIWTNSLPWLLGDQFDSVMNYPACDTAFDLIKKNISPKIFKERITKIQHWYPHTVNPALFNLVGSHDTQRVLTRCGNEETFKLIYTFMFTFFGTPCIYYGDEIGMTGASDPGCRGCMQWDKTKQNQNIFKFVQELILIRKKHMALFTEGSFEVQHTSDELSYVIISRKLKDQRIYVILNTGFFVLHAKASSYRHMTNALTGERLKEILIPPNSAFVFHINDGAVFVFQLTALQLQLAERVTKVTSSVDPLQILGDLIRAGDYQLVPSFLKSYPTLEVPGPFLVTVAKSLIAAANPKSVRALVEVFFCKNPSLNDAALCCDALNSRNSNLVYLFQNAYVWGRWMRQLYTLLRSPDSEFYLIPEVATPIVIEVHHHLCRLLVVWKVKRSFSGGSLDMKKPKAATPRRARSPPPSPPLGNIVNLRKDVRPKQRTSSF